MYVCCRLVHHNVNVVIQKRSLVRQGLFHQLGVRSRRFFIVCSLLTAEKHFLQPFNVLRLAQLRDACGKHQREERDDDVRRPTHDVVRRAGDVDEVLVHGRLLAAQNVCVHGCEDEGRGLSLDTKLRLEVAKEMAEIDMKQRAVLLHHDVVVVSVTDTEDVRCNAISRARVEEVPHAFLDALPRLVARLLPQPVDHGVLAERHHRTSRLLRNVGNRVTVQHHLDHPHSVVASHAPVGRHVKVQPLRLPHRVHHRNNLQSQQILSQIVASLEDDVDRLSHRVCVFEHEEQRQLLRVHHLAPLDDEPACLHAAVQRQREGGVRLQQLLQLLVKLRADVRVALLLLLLLLHVHPDLQQALDQGVLLLEQAPHRHRHALQQLFNQQPVTLLHGRVGHLRLEVPEDGVADLVRVADRPLEQEAGERRVVVRLVLQHLHQLQDALRQQRVAQLVEDEDRVRPHLRVRVPRVQQLKRHQLLALRRLAPPPALVRVVQQLEAVLDGGGAGPVHGLQELRERGRVVRQVFAELPQQLFVNGVEAVEGIPLDDDAHPPQLVHHVLPQRRVELVHGLLVALCELALHVCGHVAARKLDLAGKGGQADVDGKVLSALRLRVDLRRGHNADRVGLLVADPHAQRLVAHAEVVQVVEELVVHPAEVEDRRVLRLLLLAVHAAEVAVHAVHPAPAVGLALGLL
eukprot:Rhum_TRINITY_DN13228_c3_g1::Rhum_TRINITY_DN13228_c3_g1_i1::g.58405::m.58405